MSDLEQRIAAALNNDAASSEMLGTLVRETERAITTANATAKAEREKALDLRASPDAKAAREAVAGAEFACERLGKALPRLRGRMEETMAAEYLCRWNAECDALARERDDLAGQLRAYAGLAARLADLMARLAIFEEKLSQLHLRRPSGVSRHLRSPELAARNLDHFDREHPPLGKNLVLPEWGCSDRMMFPSPQRRDMSMFAPTMHDDRFSGNWAATIEAQDAERQVEMQRVATHYKE